MSNPDHDRRQRLRPLAAHRRGIALILAIVILVGLLLLGLPFFMSQSTSLSGARNFRSAEQASTGSDSAMRVGLAVGIAVMQDHLRPAVNNEALSPREWTRLDETGLVMKPDVIKLGADNNRAVINLDSLGIFNYETTTQGVPANRLLASLTIEDESGKLDPNTMSVAMWHQLIQRVFDPQKIGYQVDWDDDEVVCSKASDGFDQNTGIHHWRQNNDPDHFGQLAQALAEQPRRMPGGRITELEQLLLADTGHSASRNDKNLKKGYDEPSAPSPTFGLRRPLTRTELNRLRPYLSLYNPAPGRQGLIDFGTVVQVQSNNNGSVNTNVLWDVPSWLIGRNQPWGWGSVLACQAPDQKSWKYGWLTVQTGGAWYIQGSADQPQPGQNSAGALLAPPVLNVNAASKTVLGALGINKDSLPRDEKKLEKRWHLSKLALASDMPTAPMTSLMNESWIPNFDQNKLTAFNAWHLQDPFRMMERIGGSDCPVSLPPLGIASTGIFTVTAAAAATDGQGRQDARSLRRMVIQASSQERMVERRWQTQDDMYALAAQRFTNAVDTWPHPVNRVLPLGAYDPTATNPDQAHCWPADVPAVTDALLNDQHMFRPTTLPNWATNLSNGVDWAMDFGAKTPLKTNTETVLRTTPGLVNPTLSPDIGFQDLRPDGLRLPSDGRRVATSAVGPLQRRDNNTQEMAGRHFSLWVKPENEWINSATPIPIFEARVNAGLAIKPIKRKPDIVNNIGEVIATGEIDVSGLSDNQTAGNDPSDSQNLLGLYYDPKHELLALVIAPPSVPYFESMGPKIAWDNPDTPDINEECLGFGYSPNATITQDELSLFGYDLTPALTNNLSLFRLVSAPKPAPYQFPLSTASSLLGPNRIVTLFSTRSDAKKTAGANCYFQKGRWHQIQVVVGSSRPGGNAILVDNVAGRDVLAQAGNNGSISILGFGDHVTLPALPLKIPIAKLEDDKRWDLQKPNTIEVNPVDIHGVTLTAQDLFPERGSLRIDDEYFRYQSITGNVFNNCIRGTRQQTWTSKTKDVTDKNGDVSKVWDEIYHWPGTEDHRLGTLVLPGDYRINGATSGSGKLYKGGCSLRDPLPTGLPDTGHDYDYRIWFPLPSRAVGNVIPSPGDLTGKLFTLQLTPKSPDDSIPADPSRPDIKALLKLFPEKGGIIGIGSKTRTKSGMTRVMPSRILAYGTRNLDTLSLEKVVEIPTLDITGGIDPGTATGYPSLEELCKEPYPFDLDTPSTQAVFLLSIATSGKDPGKNERYSITPFPDWESRNLLQIQDPDSGRIEWLAYDLIIKAGDTSYFTTTRKGWFWDGTVGNVTRNRGMMRTEYYGREGIAPTLPTLAITTEFPVGSAIIPVQTALGQYGRLLATGDVVTLMPKTLRAPADKKTTQAVVRFSATDGYGAKNQGPDPLSDVKNGYFAFAHHLPDDAETALANLDILKGTCWTTPWDHSPMDRMTGMDGYHLPRMDGIENDGVILGGSRSTALRGMNATIDAVAAGPMPPGFSYPSFANQVYEWLSPDGKKTIVLNGIKGEGLPCLVQAYEPIFAGCPSVGLVHIGGEVFAYQQIQDLVTKTASKNTVRLVGRGLLGSQIIPHQTGESLMILPMGPVALLDGIIPDPTPTTTPFQFRFDNRVFDSPATGTKDINPGCEFVAPTIFVCDPYGIGDSNTASAEVMVIYGGQGRLTDKDELDLKPDHPVGVTPDPNNKDHWRNFLQTSYTTTAWTRGLYNTTPHKWTKSSDGLHPIVIGWWPRYPSALPKDEPGDPVAAAAMYRSRVYPWVGFPHGLYSSWFLPDYFRNVFDPDHKIPPVALVTIPYTDTSELFTIEARALSRGLDWTQSDHLELDRFDKPIAINDKPFTNKKQFKHAVDGAEMRITWRYKEGPKNENDPLLQLLDLANNSSRAPAIGPVRLRCLAPTRLLTTDAVR